MLNKIKNKLGRIYWNTSKPKRVTLTILSVLVLILSINTIISLAFNVDVLSSGIGNILRRAGVYTSEVKKVTIQSNDYDQGGSWSIDKSAKWTGKGKAQVTFDVTSKVKATDAAQDIILVLDTSGSMFGEKLTKVKEDASELVESIFQNNANKVALIKFGSTSQILSGLISNKQNILDQINNLTVSGNTNYNAALQNVETVLENYEKQEGRELKTLFLTDGYPNEDTPNQVATYQIIKEQYPYMDIEGIQYEIGDTIINEIKRISDHQWNAYTDNLDNILFQAAGALKYDNFVVTDYIEDEYFYIDSVNDIEVSIGTVNLDVENGVQKITWDLGANYYTGSKASMKINLKLQNEYVGVTTLGYYPTNKSETIESKLKDEQKKTKDSLLTPVLKNVYKVAYDTNTPTGCILPDIADEDHYVYENVLIHEGVTCPGYNFRGWEITTDDVTRLNNDYFVMPGEDVKLKAIWGKESISKSMDGTIYIYSPTTTLYADGTLIINELDREENISRHGAIVKEYDGLSNNQPYVWTSYSSASWYNERAQITRVEIGEEIHPTSTAYWFYDARYMTSGDFSNLDTSHVTTMRGMFYKAGRSATTWNIGDLSGWNTSQVTDMSNMFNAAGQSATTWNIGDLSGWNTSQVTDMSNMFTNAGQSATTWDIGDLSGWKTSQVTDMSNMFNVAGYSATNFAIGDLSEWNTSSVTTMRSMFNNAGYSATNFAIGDLSGWNTSNVTTMETMFYYAGYNATTFDIGDLDNWTISNVETMRSMFYNAGRSATTWNIGDLSGWRPSQVTDMSYMFCNAGYKATTWDIGNLDNWNTGEVTDMTSMFEQSGYSATTWNIGNLDQWTVSKVESMFNMFTNAGNSAASWGIGDLSGWDTSHVTTMNAMFQGAGYNAGTWDIGGLNIYADDITNIFTGCEVIATINIYSNPTHYDRAFYLASRHADANIIVNYSNTTTNIDNIIATRYDTACHITKGAEITP